MGLTPLAKPAGMPVRTLPFDASALEFLHTQSIPAPVGAKPKAEVEFGRRASDEALVSEAKAGEHHAFVELCDRYGRCVKQRIFRIVKNRDDADDVFQETLMRAYKHLNGFRGGCSFQTWITQIAINSALMLLRWRRIRSETCIEIVGEGGELISHWPIPDSSPNPEQLYLRRQTSQILSEAVTNLPPKYRSIVEQCHGKELKLSDAAQALGLKDGAAKSRLFRARALLRRRLQNQVSSLT
ncbi:MAG: RNA polymerase sigma factor [Terracidiphilus sp.]